MREKTTEFLPCMHGDVGKATVVTAAQLTLWGGHAIAW